MTESNSPAPTGRDFWERTAKRYDASMLLFGGPLEEMKQRVVAAVKGRDRVLELAAGTGLVTEAIAPVVTRLVATDYSAAMVAELDARVRAQGLSNVETRTLDVYELVDASAFDAIVATNVLHLLPDLDAALAAMGGALRPDGVLVVPTYCHDQTVVARVISAVMSVVGFPGQRRLTLERLEELVASRGFEVRSSRLLPGLLPIGFVSCVKRA